MTNLSPWEATTSASTTCRLFRIMKRSSLVFARILFVVYLLAVVYLCFCDLQGLPHVSRRFMGIETDKIVHFLMFLPYPILLYYALGMKVGNPFMALVFILLIFGSGCLIAGGTEILQGKTGYRVADIRDFKADSLSLAIGSLIVFIIDLFRTE